jgi:hypothetical protein
MHQTNVSYRFLPTGACAGSSDQQFRPPAISVLEMTAALDPHRTIATDTFRVL